MTVLGGGFSMGSSAEPSTMNMSLDEMIANRAKQGTRRSTRSRGGASSNVNKVSNVDKTIGSSKAKREAALRARRGMSKSGKASQMEIEKAVQKQHNKTIQDKAKKAKQSKHGTKTAEERAEVRQERRAIARAAAKAKKEELAAKGQKRGNTTGGGNATKVAETAPLGRPPSKKAVNAAVAAMEEKGFTVPDGFQMVISFAPTASSTLANNQPASKKPARGRRGGGRGGRGGGGGRN
mmetsp:Transcript_11737/g.26103  ORF Transcript_11737/g.26103 Transcript_11737/m.26103 type:complete len:237 (-) Transcript_11737:92-802(-)|eukprot:CAMPEP_0168778934 /NCGR_PEP_ID=MMETSP0725-20121227/7334_1 /TAXON_ID=265536 /ORGANISM="Amphiprora sp., Strain CCMP467" /LENGTH=236 /DNA_ID=CAMNT_0008828711 /DNA_START=173 /DNA_END=883 /DNA_ORIENTATION=+